jgi:hypothetical protein
MLKKVCYKQEIGFSSIGLAMASIKFNFIDNMNINYSMSSGAIESNLGTYTSKLPTFLGW